VAGSVDVFISYAPEDEILREELEAHLSGLKHAGVIRTWSSRRIVAGDRWKEAVETKLGGAGVVLLLVSADYLASDYLYEVEATAALGRERAGRARVIPVLLRECVWEIAAFEGLAPLPANGKPVTGWSDRDAAWAEVVRGIRTAIAGERAPAVALLPAYESPAIRAAAEELERAWIQRAALFEAGASREAIDQEILRLRRILREGGQLRAGDTLGDGRYLLLGRLGKGGFGSVWAARDKRRGEDVAIKVLHPSEAQDRSRRDRFFRGARVMASLRHEGVVRVLEERGEDEGYLYFVMELVAGQDLHRAVVEKRLRREDVVPVLVQVADALGEAHAQGIVHRDVKPSNVVLDASGRPKLTDFDLVAARSTTGGTRTGALGTFLYAAPEQLHDAQHADARADVFGLGMTAVFCLRGEELPALMPYKREEVIAALPCSEAIKVVVRRAIALEPADRYEDARAFGEALRAAAMPIPPVKAPVAPPPPDGESPQGTLVTGAPESPWLRPPVREDIETTRVAPLGSSVKIRRTATVLAIVLSLALVGGMSAVVVGRGGGGPDAGAPDTGTTTTTEATLVSVTTGAADASPVLDAGPCPEGMVLVPGDTFTMGSDDGDADEKPKHLVKLSTFCIDRTEVTVSDYRKCTKETRNGMTCSQAPTTVQWSGYSADQVKLWSQFCNGDKPEKDRHPINCVDWDQASRYCTWARKYLPSEAQWEYAARGKDGRKYPWGNDKPTAKLLNACGKECRELGKRNGFTWKVMYEEDDGAEATAEAGKYPDGQSPFGAMDMAGNVWEWVADWYGSYPADGKTTAQDPQGPEKGTSRVIRGGGWNSVDPSRVRAAYHDGYDVSLRGSIVGFRCARGLK
jgi:eukaryotic-like serine/threonine-protein kinase